MHEITKRAIKLWKELPDDQLNKMPHTYNIRVQLGREFGMRPARTGGYTDAAIRILKIRKRRSKAFNPTPTPGRTGVLRGRIASAISTLLATHPDTSDAQIIAALGAVLEVYQRGAARHERGQGGLSAENLEEELDMRPKEVVIQQASANLLFIRASSNDALIAIRQEAEKYGNFHEGEGSSPHHLIVGLEWDTSEVKARLEQLDDE